MVTGSPLLSKQSLIILLGVISITGPAVAQPATRVTQADRLRRLETDHHAQFALEHAAARQWAQAQGMPMRDVRVDGRITSLQFLRGGQPFTYTTLNTTSGTDSPPKAGTPASIS